MNEAIEAGGSAPPVIIDKPKRTFRMKQPPKDEIRRQREVALAEAAYWKARYRRSWCARCGEFFGWLR
jgi:hypothetical protein